MLLAFGHGKVEYLLGGDSLAVPVTKRPTLPVDVKEPPVCMCL